MSDHDPEILAMFLAEARERLSSFQNGMLALEASPDDGELLNALFRDMHTVKGGARYLDCAPVSELCHAVEDYLDDLRNGKGTVTKEITSLLLTAVDHLDLAFIHLERQDPVPADLTSGLIARLAKILEDEDEEGSVPSDDAVALALKSSIYEQSDIIRAALDGLSDPAVADEARGRCGAAADAMRNACEYAGNDEAVALVQSLRMAILAVKTGAETAVERTRILSELDRLGRAVKPFDPTRRITGQHLRPTGRLPMPGEQVHVEKASTGDGSKNRSDGATPANSSTSLRVEEARIDRGIALAGELSIMRSGLRHAARQIARDPTNLAPIFEAADVLDRISNEIEEHAIGLRRVAMRYCFGRFPRVVRDLALSLNKDIDLVVDGDGIEVDKTVVEALSEPLVHVLRNACDHGLEGPEDRAKAGKARRGQVRVSAAYEGKQVIIEITDDGRGIPIEKVAAKAISLGLITAEAVQRMPADERTQLVFLPGLSTAEKITDVSGRGVGMDVVKRTVDGLGGQIRITTTAGAGSTFRIVLPPTSFALSVTSSVLIRMGEAAYALPMEVVRETVKMPLDDIQSLGGHPAICLRGDLIPIRSLAELLIRGGSATAPTREGLRRVVRDGQVAIAILITPSGPLGLAVDQLIGQQGLVVKPLPAILGHLPGIAGASIQADGSILLMIDAASLIAVAEQSQSTVRPIES